jgi:polysaccharide deacetylase 2 family uncharacterized protein YibQ
MAGLDQRDELSEPLGVKPPPRRKLSLRLVALSLSVLILAALGVFLAKTDNRLGGEPFAVASIEQRAAVGASSAPAHPPEAAAPAAPSGQMSATQVEAQSGVKVVRGGGGAAPGAMIIEVPQALGLHLTAAPDDRLIEKSRYGLLPRVGADGARPADVYSRPSLVPDKLKAAPHIAILVGGLGLSEDGTADAIRELPGPVSLAFAPYGAQVARQAADARDAGHEIFLQAPMEPFDYATNNPGPHTLLTSGSDSQILDDLHWLMARFPGYVGVTNFLGAKFTAEEAPLSLALRDIASRGLIYVDDGSSPRSLARSLAGHLALPAASADVVIDASQKPQAIEEALTRLEAMARANGSALGVATALPMSVEHVSRWARSLEARGLALTPVSAIVTRGPGPAAQVVAPDAPAVNR